MDIKFLYSIIEPYADWSNDKGYIKNYLALHALNSFNLELCKCKPDKEYDCGQQSGHLSYLPFLVKMRKALNKGMYMRACSELCSLMHYEPFSQARIIANVNSLLNEYLE